MVAAAVAADNGDPLGRRGVRVTCLLRRRQRLVRGRQEATGHVGSRRGHLDACSGDPAQTTGSEIGQRCSLAPAGSGDMRGQHPVPEGDLLGRVAPCVVDGGGLARRGRLARRSEGRVQVAGGAGWAGDVDPSCCHRGLTNPVARWPRMLVLQRR